MPHKKKVFKKENSEKFLLLRGNSQAVNADGQTLENILVPVSKNYKPGTSLLMSNIPALTNLEVDEVIEEHEDIEGIFDDASTVDHSDAAEDVVENLLSDIKDLKFSRQLEKFNSFNGDDDDDDDDNDDDKEKYDQDRRNNSKRDGSRNVQNCSENWKMFNEKFDKILEEYDDSEIGSLEDDMDIHGTHMGSPEPFIGDVCAHKKELELVLGDYDKDLKEKILNYVDDNDEENIVEIVTEKPLEFDCESILSTCSNKYNHPVVIKEEKIQRFRNSSQTSDNESESESESDSKTNCKLLSNKCNIRKKGETPEERKERQRKFKEVKKLRRELKKQNKEAFKEEKKLQSMKDYQNATIKLF